MNSSEGSNELEIGNFAYFDDKMQLVDGYEKDEAYLEHKQTKVVVADGKERLRWFMY